MVASKIDSQAGAEPDRTLEADDDASSPSKPIVTLILIVHLFFVAISLSGNFAPSDLEQRLLGRFAAYVRTFNFDLNFTPYYWTRGTEADVDHRIEVLPRNGDEAKPEDWRVLPDVGWRGGERYKRYQRLATTFALQAEDDVMAGRIAQSIGTHFSRAEATAPKQVRSRGHFLQPMDALVNGSADERNPESAVYFRTPYAANCIVGKDGLVSIVKIDEASQVARPNARPSTPPSVPPNPTTNPLLNVPLGSPPK